MWMKRLSALLRHLAAPARQRAQPRSGTGAHHPLLHGEVSLDTVAIHLIRPNGDNESIALEAIDYITADRYAGSNEVYWLNFRSFSHAPACIPSLAKGFERVYPLLDTLEGFDLAQWQAVSANTEPQSQVLLWRRNTLDDFVVPADTTPNTEALARGLYLEHLGQWVPWCTYDAVGQLPFIHTQVERYPNAEFSGLRYVIQRPVIANGLKLRHLYTLTDAARGAPKLHLPVLKWQSDIRLGGDPEPAFGRIRQHLDRYFGFSGQPMDGDVNDTTLEGRWRHDRVTVSLRCFYRDEIRGWDSVAWLAIEHSPDLSPYYRSEYGNRLVRGPSLKWQRFPFDLNIAADYRQVDNAIFTPACFKEVFDEQHGMVIWHDTASNCLGVANAHFALTFEYRECQQLKLIVRRFRGDEADNCLEITLREGAVAVGSVSDTSRFEHAMEAITHLTGLATDKCVFDEYY